jgi:hypothetical protein
MRRKFKVKLDIQLIPDSRLGPPSVRVSFPDGAVVDFGLSGYAEDWDLPRGSIEDYRPVAEAALRELCRQGIHRRKNRNGAYEALHAFCKLRS